MRWFAPLLLLAVVVAVGWPAPFAGAAGAIVPLLVLVMFGMGLTLRPADFRAVLARPRWLVLGVTLHYTVMPALAALLIRAFALDAPTAVGVALVGSTSAGTASNVIAYLGRGSVALSVSLTALSTLLAVVATPWLVWWLVGATVAVPAAQMMRTVATVAVLPVLAGMLVRWLAPRPVERLAPWLPTVSAATVVVIVTVIVALNAGRLSLAAAPVFLVVVLHNGGGLAAGYGLSRLLGADEAAARTIAVEVGMQNSGLAVALALKLFGAAAALPGALFSVWHNLSGSLLASRWARQAPPGPP